MVYSVGYINISSSCLFPNPTQSAFRFQRTQQLDFQNRLQSNTWLMDNFDLSKRTIYGSFGPRPIKTDHFAVFLLCGSFIHQFFLWKFPFSPSKSAYIGSLSTMTYELTAIGVRGGLITFQSGKLRNGEDLGKILHFEFGSDLVLRKSQYRFKTEEK